MVIEFGQQKIKPESKRKSHMGGYFTDVVWFPAPVPNSLDLTPLHTVINRCTFA